MVFSSTIFLFVFLPLVWGGYYVIRYQFRNYWLLGVSLVFFAWSQPNYIWIIFASIIVNYIGGLLVRERRFWSNLFLVMTIGMNLILLFYFKYFDFAIELINKFLAMSFKLKNIVLPVGISFFTFQGMSYVIDVYRGHVEPQKNPFKVALYIVLFPQLVAGPIVRYTNIAEEIDYRTVTLEEFGQGIERFIVGLTKKAVLANTLASTVDSIWIQNGGQCAWSIAWLASIAYTMQIYFDFSGYSDMAIGLGLTLGFHFNENFNLPYISASITEFWRRWHISLSSWFRDYVYIPLGGNRKRVYLNLTIVFLLTGIWHGASWHFIIWGVWNGAFILLERFVGDWKRKRGIGTEKLGVFRIFSQIYTLLIVNLGWVLFRAEHVSLALQMIKSMFGLTKVSFNRFSIFWYLDRWTMLILLLGFFFAGSLPRRIYKKLSGSMKEELLLGIKYMVLLGMFLFSAMRIVSGTYNPFIYFQF